MTMNRALALLEYESVAAGVLAVDRMLKKSPVALLRCGSVHPGRWLALVGGTVAATEEAHAEGCAQPALSDQVCLADPHPALAAAVQGQRSAPEGEALGVVESATSPALLAAIDAALKSVPVRLAELRLADDLGGRAVAFLDGLLPDVEAALDVARGRLETGGRLVAATLMPRLDDALRDVLAETTRFGACPLWQPEGGEALED
jgi:microcompartment protein CcmL/EutN